MHCLASIKIKKKIGLFYYPYWNPGLSGTNLSMPGFVGLNNLEGRGSLRNERASPAQFSY